MKSYLVSWKFFGSVEWARTVPVAAWDRGDAIRKLALREWGPKGAPMNVQFNAVEEA